MMIIPAIDIKDSQCVRLRQGNIENKEVFARDPVEVAKKWEEAGAELLHMVDLDGAFQGKPIHDSLIRRIAQEVNIPLQVGGGIRDEAVIREYLDAGILRVVLGTFLLSQGTDKITDIIRNFGNHLVAGIDVRNNRIAIQGWVKEVDEPVETFITYLSKLGIQRFIYTDISRDGMLNGPNIAVIQEILRRNRLKIIASGGISTMDDLYHLKQLTGSGLEGVIIGQALYKGKISLEEAIKVFQEPGGDVIK